VKKYVFVVFFVLTFVSFAHAGQKSRIELTNGSVLEGEIISFSGGQYTVKSSTLGTFRITDSQVRAIRSGDAATVPSGNESASPEVVAAQSKIQEFRPELANNPEVMKALPGLMANPDFQALLSDPEIVRAAKAGDFKALMANEKIARATSNPAIQNVAQKVKGQKPSEG
jgi:hypothetical protein